MATQTVSRDPEVESHYATQTALTAALLTRTQMLWQTVEPLSSDAAWDLFGEGVGAVVEQLSAASISLSADYYEAMRENAGVTGSFRTPIVDTPPQSLVDAGLEWAKRAEREMAADAAAIQARVDAAMQKAVADAGRSQVIAAVAGDEKALGFARVSKPGACYFCVEQAIRRKKDGRPGVYKTRGSSGAAANERFTGTGAAKFHNHCHCVIVPVFNNDYQLEPHIAADEKLYFDSTKDSKRGQLSNDFRRALEARNAGKDLPTDSPTGSVAPDLVSQRDQLTALLGRLPKPSSN